MDQYQAHVPRYCERLVIKKKTPTQIYLAKQTQNPLLQHWKGRHGIAQLKLLRNCKDSAAERHFKITRYSRFSLIVGMGGSKIVFSASAAHVTCEAGVQQALCYMTSYCTVHYINSRTPHINYVCTVPYVYSYLHTASTSNYLPRHVKERL